MRRVVWDDRALRELAAIGDYIAKDSPRSAGRVLSYLRDAALLLETSPRLGREVEGETARELVLRQYPYVLIYDVSETEVRILAVFHHRQKRR